MIEVMSISIWDMHPSPVWPKRSKSGVLWCFQKKWKQIRYSKIFQIPFAFSQLCLLVGHMSFLLAALPRSVGVHSYRRSLVQKWGTRTLSTMWGPLAKLVNITPITMVYDTQITRVNGGYKPTYNQGGPHCSLKPQFPLLILWFQGLKPRSSRDSSGLLEAKGKGSTNKQNVILNYKSNIQGKIPLWSCQASCVT